MQETLPELVDNINTRAMGQGYMGPWAYGVVVSTSVFTEAIRVRIPAGTVEFDIANLW